MKKTEPKKEKKEIKKKPAHAAKKAAPKVKKEVKKELKPKKAPKAEAALKIEAPKAAIAGKPAHVVHVEERKAAPEKKKSPKKTQYHGTGGRKTSGARVWISEGSGKYLINGRSLENYTCGRQLLLKMAMEPLVTTNTVSKFDIYADVHGGGVCSQIGAVRQGVSVALTQANPEHRPILRKTGLLTRDPRMKERKKYGQKRARKRFQFSKR